MSVESATYVSQLVGTNPVHSDGVNQGDAHLRLIKNTLQATFPGASSPVTHWSAVAATGGDAQLGGGYAADATAGFQRTATGTQTVIGMLRGKGTVPVGSVHMFVNDPGAVMARGGGTISSSSDFLWMDGSFYSLTTNPQLAALAAMQPAWVSSGGIIVPNMEANGYFPRAAGGFIAVNTFAADRITQHEHTASTGISAQDLGHNHGVVDSGHNHGGVTGLENQQHNHNFTAQLGAAEGNGSLQSGSGVFWAGNQTGTTGTENQQHNHNIPLGATGISIANSGSGYVINGATTTIGGITGQGTTTVSSETAPKAYGMYFAVKI